MRIHRKITLGLLTTLLLATACSDQNEPKVNVGLSKDDGESKLAEAVFCTASSDEIKKYSNPFNGDIKTWQATFEDIHKNAQTQANTLKQKDGAAIERRLNTIKAQTRKTLVDLDEAGDSESFKRFIEQTMQQCASFAS